MATPTTTATPRTIRNNRNGEAVHTTLTNQEACNLLCQEHGERTEHWLWFWIHKLAGEVQSRGAAATRDAGDALAFIADSFCYAIAQGLKKPMLRLHFENQRFKLYLSARGTVCIKTGMLVDNTVTGCKDPVGDERYLGCMLYGRFLPARDRATNQNLPLNEVEQEFIENIKHDANDFIAWCGRDMGRCCYCNQPLEDERSKKVGYGKTCASRWGLPWGDDDYMEKAPSFAKLYDTGAAGLCQAIRANPTDPFNWQVFCDWMEEHGLPRGSMPRSDVTLPRAE